jgi:glutamate/tyrosine decarboxylase-like PLP-dependent enzyme
MKKLKLGGNPKSFNKSVDIVLLDGTVAALLVTFKYRTRSQFATMVDEGIAKAEADAKAAKELKLDVAAESERITVADNFATVDGARVQHVLKIAEGWDLEDDFTEVNLLQFEDENPGALNAIAAVYAQAVAEARVKN